MPANVNEIHRTHTLTQCMLTEVDREGEREGKKEKDGVRDRGETTDEKTTKYQKIMECCWSAVVIKTKEFCRR